MELYERIRRDRQAGAGIRELSRRYKVHRRTVHEALESAVPRTRKAPVRESPVLGPWKPVIRGWLEADVKEEVRASSGTRPVGCGSAWRRSTARRSASRRCASTSRR